MSFFAPMQHIKSIITLVLLGAESRLIALFKEHIVAHYEPNKKVLAFCKL